MQRVAIVVGVAFALAANAFVVANAATTPRAPAPQVQMGYYDDHLDAFVSTDSSSKAEARAMHINYAPGLASLKPARFPKIYMVQGTAAPGQLTVLGSQPGETDYSPIWHEVMVTWSQGVTPTLLTSDTQIEQLATMNELQAMPTSVLINCPVIATEVPQGTTVAPPKAFRTFYDGHKDGMLATDVSNRAQATAEHINYSPVLAKLNPNRSPELYIVKGRAAMGQLMILGSQPGETNYSPLWHEVNIYWVHGVTPRLIKSDTQIDKLEAKGLLKERSTATILNCPVTSVGG